MVVVGGLYGAGFPGAGALLAAGVLVGVAEGVVSNIANTPPTIASKR